MRIGRLFLLSILVLISSSLAKADTITFEGLGDGTSVTNQFSSILFSNAIVLTAGASLNEFEFPPNSGANVVFDNGGPVSITFGSPVSGVSGFFTYVTQLTITAYDSSDNIIGTLTSAFNDNTALSGDPGSQFNEFLSFSVVSGISRITISGDPAGGSFTLDDLTFTQSASEVPEPGSILLILTGGSVLLGFRKRFSRNP
jgi:hypothetical protein